MTISNHSDVDVPSIPRVVLTDEILITKVLTRNDDLNRCRQTTIWLATKESTTKKSKVLLASPPLGTELPMPSCPSNSVYN